MYNGFPFQAFVLTDCFVDFDQVFKIVKIVLYLSKNNFRQD